MQSRWTVVDRLDRMTKKRDGKLKRDFQKREKVNKKLSLRQSESDYIKSN